VVWLQLSIRLTENCLLVLQGPPRRRQCFISYQHCSALAFTPSLFNFYTKVLNKNTEFLFLCLILLQNKSQGSVSMLLKI